VVQKVGAGHFNPENPRLLNIKILLDDRIAGVQKLFPLSREHLTIDPEKSNS
jgi:hypothetical protein